MLKSFFTKVSVLFLFAFLPFSLLANTEIIGENAQHELINSVIKSFRNKGVKGFTISEVKLKSFALPSNTDPKKLIEIVPLKLVIDDVIVFRTQTSSATELVAYQSNPVEARSIRSSSFYTPG